MKKETIDLIKSFTPAPKRVVFCTGMWNAIAIHDALAVLGLNPITAASPEELATHDGTYDWDEDEVENEKRKWPGMWPPDADRTSCLVRSPYYPEDVLKMVKAIHSDESWYEDHAKEAEKYRMDNKYYDGDTGEIVTVPD